MDEADGLPVSHAAAAGARDDTDELVTSPKASLSVVSGACNPSSVPAIVITPPSDDDEVEDYWTAVTLPIQYTMGGNLLVVPGFKTFENPAAFASRGIWQKYDSEDSAGLTEDDDEEEDSEEEDDERSWVYPSNVALYDESTKAEFHSPILRTPPPCSNSGWLEKQRALGEVVDVKAVFHIDEDDEDDLPDLPSDWA